MPEPTQLPEWASNPTDPGDIVEPSGAKKEDGWNATERPPAQYFNWWMNLVYQWTEYLRDERDAIVADLTPLTESVTRTRVVPLDAIIPSSQSGVDWEYHHDVAGLGIPAWHPTADDAVLVVPIRLPHGSTLRGFRIHLSTAGGRPFAEAWRFHVYRDTHDWSLGTTAAPTRNQYAAPNLGTGANTDASANGIKTVAVTMTSQVIDNDYAYYLYITGPNGSTAALGAADRLFGIRIQWDDVAVRNY